MTNTENPTMPDTQGRELTLLQHVEQSTLAHPFWHELDHAGYLISEVGFDGDYVQSMIPQIIDEMVNVRLRQAELLHGRPLTDQ